ncbi:GntR family transcriptional regulator [Microbacterium sp. C5A9]|uniref:GntR family transcriptional regulator n=1 Tax=Microbacterium sp. C5A9 TaxID=2736663 RepID=UPI001F519514|nr:GntR family transcriptional regulator [Microbacterium sp. C5A9]MCI1018791.1 GntR family transcriptional regulator [Microbacterium sp. C5A9]
MTAHPDRTTASAVTPNPAEESSPAIDIYRQFRGLIVSGQLGAGERLPTVRQTASDLGVAAGTAARAYRLLERDGLVVTRTAAGTRVSDSAGVVPHAVIRQIRDLVAAAEDSGSAIEDVIDVLRVVARSSSGTPEAETR